MEVELLVDSAAALSVLLTGISSRLRYSAKSQGLAAAWCAATIRDFAVRARKVATDHNLADLFTKAVDLFTFRCLTDLMGWTTYEKACKFRCIGRHESPTHDEPCRCLNFVEKMNDLCEACQSPGGCRCYNGAS